MSDPADAHPIVGSQRWHDLLFLHWPVPAEAVQAKLPRGLEVDTYDGRAWVGIVPFAMARVRPRYLPPLPWLSWFLELNVRTYVRDAHGTAGVWFHSLDCDQPLAVMIAQHAFHLPYRHARMRVERSGDARRYECVRRGESAAPWQYDWSTREISHPAAVGTLEHFLVERYTLFCTDGQERLHRGHVAHSPYRLHVPRVRTFSTGPAALAGYALAGAPVSILAAEPVDVTIRALRRVDR